MATTTPRCPQCRATLEDWEIGFVDQFGYCRDCADDARPRCRECNRTYLMNAERGTCGLCEGAWENARLGRY